MSGQMKLQEGVSICVVMTSADAGYQKNTYAKLMHQKPETACDAPYGRTRIEAGA